MKAQTIQIDSTFTADGEIFPFENIEIISGLSAGGEVDLNSDTSMVRIILVDENDIHYLVFEAYPLICDSLDFAFSNRCDETCSLDQIHPYSLLIQVIDAELELKDLNYETDPKQDPESQRYEAKRDKDFEKIEALNQNIPRHGMNWTAGDNSIVSSYYDQKRLMFGDGYYLLGYDYYAGGVFEFLGHRNYPQVDPDLVRHFDWRKRHGANDSLSPYWDGDTLGTGWLTSAKVQGLTCKSCWAFSSTGTVEAIANLFTTQHPDYNLSEQDLLSCSQAGDCYFGGDMDTAMLYIAQYDTVTEDCFPYYGLDYTILPCTTELKCSPPDTIINISGITRFPYTHSFNNDSLRVKLITRGPLSFSFEPEELVYHSYDISIDSGACLTISAYAAFAPQARLMVNRGGKLIVDGGCLTKACPEPWSGIEVFGSDTSQFLEKYFGVVQLQNEAVISNSKTGIANYCTVGDPFQEYNGGIIKAEFSTFLNNETDVQLAAFTNLWQGNEIPYAAWFDKCTFLTTEELYPDRVPVTHVDMKDVTGIMFYGCTFKNESELAFIPYPIRGKGIMSIDASFLLNHHCNDTNQIPCVHVDSCEFHNLVGISLSGIDYAEVLSNNFEFPKSTSHAVPDRFNGGLFMEGCTGYHVEGNNFFSLFDDMESGHSPWYGIGVKNSGPDDNEIYNNDFQRLSGGIIAIGENRGEREPSGLCLKCNDMSENINDFFVVEDDGPPTGSQGIRLYQGNPNDTISETAPAGNTFTDFGTSPANYENLTKLNYYNVAEDIYYLHHRKQFDPLTYPLDSNYTYETIELINLFTLYNKSGACPTGLGIGNSLKSCANPRQTIFEANIHISNLKSQLNELVDGGNTEMLNFEVMTSLPDEGLELSQELLIESPYLSDTVIKQAIYKEDVLPNAMIRDIMAANPQSAKKDDLLQALDDRFDPMPGYMMAQIMEGREYFGSKELLEADIQSWQQIRSKVKNDLIRQFLLDTSIVNSLDSVIAFLKTENDLKSKYDLAFAYWNKDDSANAWQTLNNIPLQFTLNDDQTDVHQHYIEYFDILKEMADSNWQACDLDSASVQSLFSLIADVNADVRAHARGLSVKGGFLQYIEKVNLPLYSKSGPNVYYSKEEISEQPNPEYLKLFPNPAGDYVIAYYYVNSDFLSGEIAINEEMLVQLLSSMIRF